jgi:putative flippase GtrA
MTAIHTLPTRLHWLVRSPTARPLRFAGTGSVAAVIQLLLLTLLMRYGWDALLADVLAFLLAAQVNFVLSLTFTWPDRRGAGSLPHYWLLYHGSIAAMASLNLLVFVLMRPVVPILVASALGIIVAGIGNYLVGDLLVFRRSPDVNNSSKDMNYRGSGEADRARHATVRWRLRSHSSNQLPTRSR